MMMKKQPAGRQRNKKLKREAAFCDIAALVQTPCCKILESISDGVFTIDAEKRIISFNRAAEAIMGFKAEEAVGEYCFDRRKPKKSALSCSNIRPAAPRPPGPWESAAPPSGAK